MRFPGMSSLKKSSTVGSNCSAIDIVTVLSLPPAALLAMGIPVGLCRSQLLCLVYAKIRIIARAIPAVLDVETVLSLPQAALLATGKPVGHHRAPYVETILSLPPAALSAMGIPVGLCRHQLLILTSLKMSILK